MRVTIKKHNERYLNLIGSQMEIEDPSEIINYLLLELKKMGYSFSSSLIPLAQPQINPREMSPMIPKHQEYSSTPKIDPVISRMAALIEDF